MKQYLDLARAVKEKGTYKAPSREGMPGTTSLFGYQFRHDLSEGFPLLTSKKLSFKNIVFELLWFLRGDTNIKYLIDNGCNIWNEDAYNYYIKLCNRDGVLDRYSFEEFIEVVKGNATRLANGQPYNYIFGDCGEQYGSLWRRWKTVVIGHNGSHNEFGEEIIDQVYDVIDGLKNNPLGRRNIITAWNPATLDNMALNACHALVQFNCRPISDYERANIYHNKKEEGDIQIKRVIGHCIYPVDYVQKDEDDIPDPIGYEVTEDEHKFLDEENIPRYYLDCQMYQRSADLFLGVPYNIASYSLLIHILCKICNMVPGEFIHSFGDVHIYDNHMDQINEQLLREPKELPTLKLTDNIDWENYDLDKIWDWGMQLFELKGYKPHPVIKGKLSTGLKK